MKMVMLLQAVHVGVGCLLMLIVQMFAGRKKKGMLVEVIDQLAVWLLIPALMFVWLVDVGRLLKLFLLYVSR